MGKRFFYKMPNGFSLSVDRKPSPVFLMDRSQVLSILGISKKKDDELQSKYDSKNILNVENGFYFQKRDNEKIQQGIKITCDLLPQLFKVWCKETKRNGSVLVNGSIQEFFEWFNDKMYLNIK